MVDNNKEKFRLQLVILHHILTRNIGGWNLETALRNLLEGNLRDEHIQDINWSFYIKSSAVEIFRGILTHSKMFDNLYHRQVDAATRRRVVSDISKESDNSFYIPNYDSNQLRNVPYVMDGLLTDVCIELDSQIHDLTLGRKEADAQGQTGSTIEKMKRVIHVKVTNMNGETAKQYQLMLNQAGHRNQERLQSTQQQKTRKAFPRRQLQELARCLHDTSDFMKGNNQISLYLFNIRKNEVEIWDSKLIGMRMGLHSLDNPHFDSSSTARQDKRWSGLQPSIKEFFETELTDQSLATLAEKVLGQIYHDQFIAANRWDIELIELNKKEGVHGTKYAASDRHRDGKRLSSEMVDILFTGFLLAHNFVSVLRDNNHLLLLNPYVFLYDDVSTKFSTYEDLVFNSNDYVRLRSRFHGKISKKDFMRPQQILAKTAPERLTSSFPAYVESVLSWNKDEYTSYWPLMGQEKSFTVTKLVLRAGEGLHPATVLFPRPEAEMDVNYLAYLKSKNARISQPPHDYDSDPEFEALWLDSSQLSYYEDNNQDWAVCFTSAWEEEFVSASKEIIPLRYEYFALQVMLARIFNQAFHHLYPNSSSPKTSLEKALNLQQSPLGSILWTLEQEDYAADVFEKISDLVSDIPFDIIKVRQILENRGKGSCVTVKAWVEKCAQALVYMRNMSFDARQLSRGIMKQDDRPPIISKDEIQKIRGLILTTFDERVFGNQFPTSVWYHCPDRTFGYLKRIETDEYMTKIDKQSGIKLFLHRTGIWIGRGGRALPWISNAQVADLPQKSRTELPAGSTVKYIEEGVDILCPN